MRTNLLKKTGAVLLTAAVAVGSAHKIAPQNRVKAADTKYVNLLKRVPLGISI